MTRTTKAHQLDFFVGDFVDVTFQLAEVTVPRELFRKILSLIDDLRPKPIPA